MKYDEKHIVTFKCESNSTKKSRKNNKCEIEDTKRIMYLVKNVIYFSFSLHETKKKSLKFKPFDGVAFRLKFISKQINFFDFFTAKINRTRMISFCISNLL